MRSTRSQVQRPLQVDGRSRFAWRKPYRHFKFFYCIIIETLFPVCYPQHIMVIGIGRLQSDCQFQMLNGPLRLLRLEIQAGEVEVNAVNEDALRIQGQGPLERLRRFFG